MLLAADVAPIDALYDALAARGLAPAPLFVTSLKDAESAAFLRAAMSRLAPALIVTTTAFAASGGVDDSTTPLDEAGVPVLQAVVATTKRAAWAESPRGLGAADLAMHVVLPELDGRVLAGVISFKNPSDLFDGLAFTGMTNQPEPDRIDAVADRIAALVRLQATPRGKRRIAVLLPDYPGAPGRTVRSSLGVTSPGTVAVPDAVPIVTGPHRTPPCRICAAVNVTWAGSASEPDFPSSPASCFSPAVPLAAAIPGIAARPRASESSALPIRAAWGESSRVLQLAIVNTTPKLHPRERDNRVIVRHLQTAPAWAMS